MLWRPEPDSVYLTGDALHRLGQNSAVEYFAARKNSNVHHLEKKIAQTLFWVMRAQATEKIAAAQATVCKPLAEEIVHMLLSGGKDLKVALQKAKILETDKTKISTTNIELLFQCHCVVMEGELPATYFRRCFAGDALHRLGQNSAVEYFAARKNSNVHHLEKKIAQTLFWVMRAQATEKIAAAQATVCKPLAEEIVHMLLSGGKDLKVALQKAKILETDKTKISTTNIELLFQCHCVVMEGELPATYFRRCFARRPFKARRICTCASFAQRGNCAHVWFVAAMLGRCADPG